MQQEKDISLIFIAQICKLNLIEFGIFRNNFIQIP